MKAADDPLTAALREARAPVACIVAKSHDRHVEQALHTTLSENLAMITDTVQHLRSEGQRVFVDCEHFFDGYRENPAYALEVVRAAAEAGAEVVVLCDTNGGMLPPWIGEIVTAASEIGVPLGIHTHNDTGCAVANTLAAVDAGVMHVQGTVNGYGERTGNAELLSVGRQPRTQVRLAAASGRLAAGGNPSRACNRRGDERATKRSSALCWSVVVRPQGGAACQRDQSGSQPLPAHRPCHRRQRHADACLRHGGSGEHPDQG